MDMRRLMVLLEKAEMKEVNDSDKDTLSPAILKKIKASIKKYGLSESEDLIKAMHHAWKDGYEKGCAEK